MNGGHKKLMALSQIQNRNVNSYQNISINERKTLFFGTVLAKENLFTETILLMSADILKTNICINGGHQTKDFCVKLYIKQYEPFLLKT